MSEYTPTVWRTGDVITAEKLNKIEEGIAGAESVTVESLSVTENGTYSEEGKAYSPVTVNVPSDFSTAVLTITGNPDGKVYVPFSDNVNDTDLTNVLAVAAGSFNVVLYKGNAIINVDATATYTAIGSLQLVATGTYLMSGNATLDFTSPTPA